MLTTVILIDSEIDQHYCIDAPLSLVSNDLHYHYHFVYLRVYINMHIKKYVANK